MLVFGGVTFEVADQTTKRLVGLVGSSKTPAHPAQATMTTCEFHPKMCVQENRKRMRQAADAESFVFWVGASIGKMYSQIPSDILCPRGQPERSVLKPIR